jgi:hypothetical protein
MEAESEKKIWKVRNTAIGTIGHRDHSPISFECLLPRNGRSRNDTAGDMRTRPPDDVSGPEDKGLKVLWDPTVVHGVVMRETGAEEE